MMEGIEDRRTIEGIVVLVGEMGVEHLPVGGAGDGSASGFGGVAAKARIVRQKGGGEGGRERGEGKSVSEKAHDGFLLSTSQGSTGKSKSREL
jgi:hypothetical protein